MKLWHLRSQQARSSSYFQFERQFFTCAGEKVDNRIRIESSHNSLFLGRQKKVSWVQPIRQSEESNPTVKMGFSDMKRTAGNCGKGTEEILSQKCWEKQERLRGHVHRYCRRESKFSLFKFQDHPIPSPFSESISLLK